MPRPLLLADDHQLFIDGMRLLLDRIDGWEVVGEARNGFQVLAFLEDNQVDCVLMDIEMPELNGIETTRRLKKIYPATIVLAVSMMGDYTTIRKMLQAGADGYLVKNTGIAELRTALDRVSRGEIYISAELSPILLEGVAGRKAPAPPLMEPLTQREREIVGLIVEGLTNEQIAERLYLSPLTVNTHRKNAMAKLNCKNTAALVRFVLKHKLLD
ncbi:response regulator transcription factor [Nibrella viscosa]|uniref:Response regulator transcription factor n=1 Tax=Nibrella viscosa TaxID=1084524 RepID=A0ABP8JXV4_9BACT